MNRLSSRSRASAGIRRRARVEDALEKSDAGLTTVAELVRVVPYRHILATREERRV